MFQTNRLVIIAGTSAVGKSTFLEKMQQGNVPHICDQLDIGFPSSYLYYDADQLHKVRQAYLTRLVLHYDFLYQYSPKGGFALLPTLIEKSYSIVVLTLHTSSEVLLKRIRKRLKRALISFVCNPGEGTAKNLYYQLKTRQFYSSASNLALQYVKWAKFIEECGVEKHLVLDSTNFDFTMARPYENNENTILKRTL